MTLLPALLGWSALLGMVSDGQHGWGWSALMVSTAGDGQHCWGQQPLTSWGSGRVARLAGCSACQAEVTRGHRPSTALLRVHPSSEPNPTPCTGFSPVSAVSSPKAGWRQHMGRVHDPSVVQNPLGDAEVTAGPCHGSPGLRGQRCLPCRKEGGTILDRNNQPTILVHQSLTKGGGQDKSSSWGFASMSWWGRSVPRQWQREGHASSNRSVSLSLSSSQGKPFCFVEVP